MIVQIGNYLNYGTPKGNSKGFKISLLSDLGQIKSINGNTDNKKAQKMSLLDFILSSISPPEVEDCEFDVVKFGTQMRDLCEQAQRIDIN